MSNAISNAISNMIKITVSTKAQAAKAEEVMSREVMYNPNLNGADYEIVVGDDWEVGIDIADPYLGGQLYSQIFAPGENAISNAISNTDNIIDSRDVIERIEELESEVLPYTAGRNMPGYMPDAEPGRYATADEARAALAEDMDRDADDADDADDAVTGASAELREQAARLRESDSDAAAAEYGCTIGGQHYWIAYDPSPTASLSDDDAAELAALRALADEAEGYADDWHHGVALIRDSYFIDYARELCEDIGGIPRDLPGYIVIDWTATADNIRADYTAVEFDGVTYWIR